MASRSIRSGWRLAAHHATRPPQSWPDQTDLGEAVGVGEGEHVVGEPVQVVGGDTGGLVAQAVAALIRYDQPQTSLRQRPDLVAPAVPEFREPVQQDGRQPVSGACLGDVQAHLAAMRSGESATPATSIRPDAPS